MCIPVSISVTSGSSRYRVEPFPVLDLGASASAVNVDGHTVAAKSGSGLTVSALAESADHGAAPPSRDRFEALHEAFAADGVLVSVPKGSVVVAPVVVDLQVVTPGAIAVPRVRIVAGEGSSVAVVVHQRSPDGVAALVVPRFEIEAADAARVHLTVIQDMGWRHRRGGTTPLRGGS